MISREEYRSYCDAVDNLTASARTAAERQVRAWCEANPDASVEECRERAREIMEGVSQVYGEAASSLAASWYDARAAAEGAGLPPAVIEQTLSADQIERVARYQAARLVAGDVAGFARACGDYLDNAVRERLNSTVISNARRDRGRGVRFARVPTGRETCAFCLMLSSRGAVYWSRESAGEQNRYHRGCDCKIVPGFEDDPDAEIVEGYDPAGMRDRMSKLEEMTGLSFDKAGDLSRISEFMRLLEPDWLAGRGAGEIDYSRMSGKQRRRIEDREHAGHELLRERGFRIAVLPTDRHMPASIDLLLGDGAYFELKSPIGHAGRINGLITDAVSKWDRLARSGDYGTPKVVFDNRFSKIDDAEAIKRLRASMEHYEAEHLDEMIFIGRYGDVRWLRR